jgi:SpoIIAA-like
MADGQKIRLLYLIGPEAREVEGDAMTADTGFRARHASSFDRVAVVSDETWMRPAMRALSFMLPGKARSFPVAELAAAKAWLAESGSSQTPASDCHEEGPPLVRRSAVSTNRAPRRPASHVARWSRPEPEEG